ncbi:MAG: transcription elongation factor GreA [Parcubacteria group bacterium Greene0714_7]|nr:MAG: transcription elongation factor GreA [Parcubacteria group bacterium Greene0714_7]
MPLTISHTTMKARTKGDQSEEQNLLSQEKFDELKLELERLVTVARREIAEGLEYARSLGDLSENAEYQAARELQAATEERIRRLEHIIKSAVIISEKKKGVAGFGSTVTIRKKGDKGEHAYTIVGSEEADMRQHKISHLSPLGEAMMNKKKGETFTFSTPSGRQEYTVIEIS